MLVRKSYAGSLHLHALNGIPSSSPATLCSALTYHSAANSSHNLATVLDIGPGPIGQE